MSAVAFEIRAGAATHPGAVRAENQDAFLVRSPVFVVADGMGGHRAGRAAAEGVVEAFRQLDWDDWADPGLLAAATLAATGRVRGLAREREGAPGSTVTGAALANHDGVPSWLVFNIGDSRTYLLRGESLEQVTVDHAEAPGHEITRAIGAGLRRTPEPDQWLVPAAVADRVLICSDGLTDELSDPLIAALLLTNQDPAAAADELVRAAVRSGGRDNVTAVVVDAVTVRGASLVAGLLDDDTRPDRPVVMS
ncbi:PP2C family protein-serine/threonine phosphatase [Nocardioides jensenii]|uniref:PP2C family protein-serine/threonine phosphatase n=1 Tax=Nocardioides jensenii TaxID=1843 RepID=UPI00082B36AA|nr:protein phosphatase 2C domain-containing protein [Nocardioides jensenii]